MHFLSATNLGIYPLSCPQIANNPYKNIAVPGKKHVFEDCGYWREPIVRRDIRSTAYTN